MQPARLVVLAGGGGSPVSGRPTPLVRLAGLSLVERAIASAHDAGFGEVVVVTGPEGDHVVRHAFDVSRKRRIAVDVVSDPHARDGTGPSVLAARDAVGEEPFAVVGVDHVLSPLLLERLRGVPAQPDAVVVVGDAVALVAGPALFEAAELSRSAGDSSLAGALSVLADAGRCRAPPIGDDEWWLDVHTKRARRRAGRALLQSTGKPLDGTIAVSLNGILSHRMVTPFLQFAYAGITPNQVTLVAAVVGASAAVCLAFGVPLIGGLLIALASVLDRSDGEVARLTYRSSAYGGFLDAVLDRTVDGIVFVGAAIYLATDDHLAAMLGSAQVPIALAVSGACLVAHLLVSYTTAKAAVDLGHGYTGTWLGGGRGRDRRLLVVTVGALVAAIAPVGLLVALIVVAVFSTWIVVTRLTRSWWVTGAGAGYVGVRAVVLDFDGTVADSMGFLTDLAVELLVDELGHERSEAARLYLATAGSDFATQLVELAPGHPRLPQVGRRFEAEKAHWMGRCELFPDVVASLDRLALADVPVFLCSSTMTAAVVDFCERNDLLGRFTSIDGWEPGRDKAAQLADCVAASGYTGSEVVFVGDARRDRDTARSAGSRFVGLVRDGHPDAFAGSGAMVVGSLSELAVGVIRALRCRVYADVDAGERSSAFAISDSSEI